VTSRRWDLGLLDRVKKAAGVGRATAPDDGGAAVKRKYQGALRLVEVERVRVLSLHVEDGRLYLKGTAPTGDARERILAAIREAGAPGDRDIVVDITVG
jgi:hypothetical protein